MVQPVYSTAGGCRVRLWGPQLGLAASAPGWGARSQPLRGVRGSGGGSPGGAECLPCPARAQDCVTCRLGHHVLRSPQRPIPLVPRPAGAQDCVTRRLGHRVLRSPQRPIPPSAASGRAGLPGAHLTANSCASRSGNCPGPENRPARQSPVVITAAASPGAPPAGRREPRIGSPNLHAGLGDCPCPGPRVYPGCFIRGAGLPAGPAVSSVGTRRSVHPPLPLLPCDSQPG